MADVGKINNKLVVDGQIYGGMAQGIGLALSEDFEDLKKHTTLAACGIPYIKDIPDAFEIHYVETPREHGPFGAAGVGELPLTSPHVAVINAINNATGVRITPPAGPAGEGAGRAEGHVEKEQMIAGCTAIAGRVDATHRAKRANRGTGSPVRRSIWMLSMDQQELRALEQPLHPGGGPGVHGRLPDPCGRPGLRRSCCQGRVAGGLEGLTQDHALSRHPGPDLRRALPPALQAQGGRGPDSRSADLERACVATPPPPARVQPLPRKGKTVAVIGSGLSGLTAAWDLARKGYSVRIFEPGSRLGGPLEGYTRPASCLRRRWRRSWSG